MKVLKEKGTGNAITNTWGDKHRVLKKV